MNQRNSKIASVGGICPFCKRSHIGLNVFEQKKCRRIQHQFIMSQKLLSAQVEKKPQSVIMSPRNTTEDIAYEENTNIKKEEIVFSKYPLPCSRWISLPVFLNDDSEVYQARVVYHRVLSSNATPSHTAMI